ncbi:YHS domain-containing protein [Micromonospora sp. DT81.3]|uniref:YHS domain-containing protein n=1 Tax=Micromonospora sp. DT81.3 TaxID=3416523 RepID=UPI003CEA7EA4
MSDQAENPTGSVALVTDPVCGMQIDPETAVTTREHDGATFYFCSQGCAAAFDADPHHGHPHPATEDFEVHTNGAGSTRERG